MLYTTLFLIISTAATVFGQLSVTQPNSNTFWVGNSLNTLAWTGNSPAQFSVFLANPDVALLSDRTALVAVVPAYDTSLTMSPGGAPPGDGYTIQLCNILNNSDIYATSQTFTIKPQGSSYPTGATSASITATGSTLTGASSTMSQATSSPTQKSGTHKTCEGMLTGFGMVGMLALAVAAM